jgi:hypothetical protein
LVRVHCVDETNGIGGTEWGSDEMELGGFGIGAGSNGQATPLGVQSHDCGTSLYLEPVQSLCHQAGGIRRGEWTSYDRCGAGVGLDRASVDEAAAVVADFGSTRAPVSSPSPGSW